MTHSTESAIATRDAQAALDARREQQLQATTKALARVAALVMVKAMEVTERLGYTHRELLGLKEGFTDEHRKLASDIMQDAFCADTVHEIMRRFGGFTLSDADDESFRVIKDELKGIGKC